MAVCGMQISCVSDNVTFGETIFVQSNLVQEWTRILQQCLRYI